MVRYTCTCSAVEKLDYLQNFMWYRSRYCIEKGWSTFFTVSLCIFLDTKFLQKSFVADPVDKNTCIYFNLKNGISCVRMCSTEAGTVLEKDGKLF